MSQKGFTLIEMLIVVVISFLLFGVIGSIASNTYPKQQLRSEVDVVVQTLRTAQSLTIARKNDSVWGIHLSSTELVLFVGGEYATRDPLYDRVHTFPSGISVTGLTDVVFDALYGTTSQGGTITLTSDATSDAVTVTINGNGVIER